MISRQSRSLAHLQNSMVLQLSHFQAIILEYNRNSTSHSRKRGSLNLQKKSNKIIKMSQFQSNQISRYTSIKKIENYDKTSKNSRLFLKTKQGKSLKGKKKLQKKALIFAKQKAYNEQVSMSSTKCIESRGQQCEKCFQFSKLNNKQKQVISKQKKLITELQNILEEIKV